MATAVCEHCNKTFTKRGLPSHIRQKHPKIEKDVPVEQPKPLKYSSVNCDISTKDEIIVNPPNIRQKRPRVKEDADISMEEDETIYTVKSSNIRQKRKAKNDIPAEEPKPGKSSDDHNILTEEDETICTVKQPRGRQKRKAKNDIPAEEPKPGKSSDIHWLDISTEDGTIISYNVTPKQRSKGYFKLNESSGKFVEEADHDESAECFQLSCKYCGERILKWQLRRHYLETHLHANKEHYVLPNIYNIQTQPYAGTLPQSDSWPIDFSLTIQDDSLLKYDRISYTSYFTTESNFQSSNELLKCFKYSVNTEYIINWYSFDYTCSICNEKILCVSLNILKITVLVHLRVRHRDNGILVKMCEEEIKCFNHAFGTNFKLFVELQNGPRLPTDLLLTGLEADFIRENAYGDYDVSGRYFPCKLCLTYFYNVIAFKKHLSQKHSFSKISCDYYYPTFVKPNQIVTDLSIIGLNSSYPLSFSKNGSKYIWCCHICGLVLEDPEVGHLFARIGTHILSKNLSYENISRIYVLLTQCPTFAQMQIYFQTLQWNCLQYQRIFKSISVEVETSERKCSFCSKTYSLPKILSSEAAEILHVLLEHDNIGSNDLLLRYLINSDAGEKFPFLDVLFGDTLEKKSNERRIRCSKCSTVFKCYKDLLLHARFHLSQHQIELERYFFAFPSTVINTILEHFIDGISSDDKFSKYNYTIYVCTTCLQVMNPDGNVNYPKIVEHIKACHYKKSSLSLEQLPQALKKTNFRIHVFSSTPCSTCGKLYASTMAAQKCCIVGQPLSIFTSKQIIAKKKSIESNDKRKFDIREFTFKTFSL